MSFGPLVNCMIIKDGLDLTGISNSVTLAGSGAALDATVFGDEWERSEVGILKAAFDYKGFAELGTGKEEEDHFATFINKTESLYTIAPARTAGEVSYFFKGKMLSREFGGQVGQMLPMAIKGVNSSSYPIVRGTLLESGKTLRTATGTGTGYLIGAASATQYIYAILHVFSITAGATLDVIIESDDNSGFTSGVTQFTFTQKTAVGAQFATRLGGPITDTYYRAKWTISGTNPSIGFAVSLGIQ